MLKTELVVKNTGASLFEFTTLLHTYVRVQDVTKVMLNGLKGHYLVDSLEKNKRSTEARNHVTISGEVDRVYENTPDILSLEETAADGSCLVIVKNNFKDTGCIVLT